MEAKEKYETKKSYEYVDHPKHYNTVPGIECIDVIQWFMGNIALAMKHMWRCGSKPGVDAIEDLEKAKRYIEFEIDRLRKPFSDLEKMICDTEEKKCENCAYFVIGTLGSESAINTWSCYAEQDCSKHSLWKQKKEISCDNCKFHCQQGTDCHEYSCWERKSNNRPCKDCDCFSPVSMNSDDCALEKNCDRI